VSDRYSGGKKACCQIRYRRDDTGCSQFPPPRKTERQAIRMRICYAQEEAHNAASGLRSYN
jgi:hypothetical protein